MANDAHFSGTLGNKCLEACIMSKLFCLSLKLSDELLISMAEKCKESQPVLQRIIETTTDDESMLFEALNLHDELEQVLANYAKLELIHTPATEQVHGDLVTPAVSSEKKEDRNILYTKKSDSFDESSSADKKD